MIRQIAKIALGVALVSSVLAVPGYSSTITVGFATTVTDAGSSVTLSGGSPNYVTGMTGVYLNEFYIGTPPYTSLTQTGTSDGLKLTCTSPGNGTVCGSTSTSETLTLYGGFSNGSYSAADGTALLSITLLSALTANTTSGFQVNFPAASISVTGNTSFLDDLFGLTNGTAVAVSAGSITSGAVSGASSSGGPATSETLQLSLTGAATATPEPASFLLTGTGLLLAGLAFRRRTSRAS